MQYFKIKTKFSIIAFIIITFALNFCLSSLAKIEIYFSLSDNPQKAIIKNINQAKTFINIAMYIFTDRKIALALIDVQQRGVKVRVYLDRSQIESTYSMSRLLVQRKIKVRISANNYIMHNKFAIIDNQILLAGSYNWIFSANNRNDENLMVIDVPEPIEIYQNQFVNLWKNKYSLERIRQLYKKTKVDFLPTSSSSAKPEDKILNINTASLEKLIQVLQISEPLTQKIIALRDELGGFKEPKDLTQLLEITNLG